MPAQVYPIPFLGGMDQSLSSVVGDPRVQFMNRVRFVEPGQMQISPGYYWDTGFGSSGLRACFQVGKNTVCVTSNGARFTSITRSDSLTVQTRAHRTPAVEAPRRVDVSPANETLPAASTVHVWGMPVTIDKWMLLIRAVQNGASYTHCCLMSEDGIEARDIDLGFAFGTSLSVNVANNQILLVNNYYTGTGYCVIYDAVHGEIDCRTYSYSTGLWTDLFVTPPTFGPIEIIQDVAVTVSGGVTYLVILENTGFIDVWNLTTGSATKIVRFDASPGGGDTVVQISAWDIYVLRITGLGYGRLFRITDGAAGSLDTNIAATASALGTLGRCVVGQNPRRISGVQASVGFAYEYQQAGGAPDFAHVYFGRIAVSVFNAAASLTVINAATVSHAYVAGRPFYVLNGTDESWYVPTINDAPILRTFSLTSVWDTDSGASRGRTYAIAATGEIPSRTQFLRGATDMGDAQDFAIQIADPLTGAMRAARVFPFVTVANGLLTTTTCQLNGSAIIVPSDAVSLAQDALLKGFEGLQPIPIDDQGAIVTAGSPWIDGAFSLAAGFPVDGPSPNLDPNGTGSVFAANTTYSYSLVGEFRDANNTLYRSAPTAAVSVTLGGTTKAKITLRFLWEAPTPSSPGTISIYRTLGNGFVFYDTGLRVGFNSPIAVDDTVTDATLIGQPILYSQGASQLNGLNPKYGVPPCRFGARGKDRVIVGGLEKKNRVRWSQTFFPGEGVCFPHATKAGWFQDFPETVTAVWAMDDAWLVASTSKWWVIFGSGPDDNGQNGSFEPPRLISPTIGCLSWRSLCETAEGLWFQAPDSQIYLIARGQYAVQWMSQRVKDELLSGMSGSQLLNPVVAIIAHPTLPTIHIFRAPHPLGNSCAPLIYDRRLQVWDGLDGDGNSDGLLGVLSGCSLVVPKSDGTIGPRYPTVASLTPTHLTVEACGNGITGASPAGATWSGQIITNDIGLFGGIGGWGHVYKIGLVAQTFANTSWTWSSWINRNYGTADNTGTMTLSDSTATDFPFMAAALAKDKCSAIRLQLTWTDRASYPSAFVLQVEQSAGAERLRASRKS